MASVIKQINQDNGYNVWGKPYIMGKLYFLRNVLTLWSGIIEHVFLQYTPIQGSHRLSQ